MADGALPGAEALAEVLADVRRYLGWHRDVAGEELHASSDGTLGAIVATMAVEVTVEGSSTPPVVVEYREVSPEGTSGPAPVEKDHERPHVLFPG